MFHKPGVKMFKYLTLYASICLQFILKKQIYNSDFVKSQTLILHVNLFFLELLNIRFLISYFARRTPFCDTISFSFDLPDLFRFYPSFLLGLITFHLPYSLWNVLCSHWLAFFPKSNHILIMYVYCLVNRNYIYVNCIVVWWMWMRVLYVQFTKLQIYRDDFKICF